MDKNRPNIELCVPNKEATFNNEDYRVQLVLSKSYL